MPNRCAHGLPLLPRTSRRQSLMTAVSWVTLGLGFAVPHAPVMAQTVRYSFTGSIVNTTITTGGTYQITVGGASGGGGLNGTVGGAGASVVGNIDFSSGTALRLVVGGQGGALSGFGLVFGGGGGGGGGSFVLSGTTALLVAGGVVVATMTQGRTLTALRAARAAQAVRAAAPVPPITAAAAAAYPVTVSAHRGSYSLGGETAKPEGSRVVAVASSAPAVMAASAVAVVAAFEAAAAAAATPAASVAVSAAAAAADHMPTRHFHRWS